MGLTCLAGRRNFPAEQRKSAPAVESGLHCITCFPALRPDRVRQLRHPPDAIPMVPQTIRSGLNLSVRHTPEKRAVAARRTDGTGSVRAVGVDEPGKDLQPHGPKCPAFECGAADSSDLDCLS